MAVYNDYPYSNMHEINLDWIIETVVNAELEINEAIDKINQALDKFQELSDKVDGMEDQVNQAVLDSRSALEKANDALSSLQSTREEIAVLARLVSMTSDRADQAIEMANSADEKANQVMEGLRDVVEVQIPIIARVASNAIDTATQAEAKADDAKATATQADAKADEAHTTAQLADTKADVAKASATQANTKADEAKAQSTAIASDVGNIENLTTEDKSNIVSAINEINDKPTYEMPTYILNESVQIAKYTEDGVTFYPVMQKIVDLGQLPNSGSKTVAHGINKSNVLRFLEIKGTASQANLSNTLPLPCSTIGSESVNNNIYVAVGSNNVTISTGRDRSGFTGQLVITYVASEPIP